MTAQITETTWNVHDVSKTFFFIQKLRLEIDTKIDGEERKNKVLEYQ